MNPSLAYDYKKMYEVKDFLDDVFYGDALLMKSFPLFVSAVQRRRLDIASTILKLYYMNQAVVQIFKPVESFPSISLPIVSLLPMSRVYLDSMYLTLPNSVLGFINVIDYFSKFAYSKMFVLKSKVSAISSAKAVITFNGFLDVIDKYKIPIGIVYTDRGGEFLKDFSDNMDEKKITHIYGNPGDKRKTAPIERFNKTLRLMIEKFRVVYGKIDSNVLEKIMTSYNNLPHGDLKYSPIEILENKNIQDKITSEAYAVKKENIMKITPITGWVRILLHKTFKKVSPIWSIELYKIKGSSNGNYQLEGLPNYFKRDEIQSVDKEHLMNKKVSIQKKERENVIKEEPIYEGRITRGKKIDYKKLLKN